MARNRHPVDDLADVRAEIKRLEAREEDLKAEVGKLMGSADHIGGDEYIATQSIGERKGNIDEKAAKAAGVDIEKYRKPPSTVVKILVERRAVEGAI